MDIREWLGANGLGKYAELFAANEIDLDLVPQLTEGDLDRLGLPVGARRRFAIAARSLLVTAPVSGDEQPAGSAHAERRQLTVMFCDLVGSTGMSQRLDPEALRELMRAYRQACSQVVERYDGHVAQHLGDGLMVYFGWPRAHEDDAERAVSAALDIVASVKRIPSDSPMQVRIGVATGSVVVGQAGDEQGEAARLAVGETPNIAARVQGLANPDEIILAQSAQRLAAGAFDYLELGEQTLKGVTAPVRCWRVIGRAQTESRFEALHGAALTPLVGREAEVGLLYERWQQAHDGDGQVVLLSGEPGIGKSRMIQALRERLAAEPHQVLLTQCSAFHGSTAFYPIVQNLTAFAGIRREDKPAQKLEKLDALIERLGMSVPEVGPLFAAALSIDTAERYPPHGLSAQRQRERTIEALAERVVAFTRSTTLVFIFEDAHWADQSTLDTLSRIVQRVRGVRALAIVTHRPEFEPPWRSQPHVTALTLNRLSRRQVVDLVEQVTGGKALPHEVLDQIVVKTDGVPLFIEELTKTVLEAGILQERDGRFVLDGPLPALAIPSTLRDSLMARLDRLVPVKEVAQIGACIGREFSERLLLSVSGMAPGKLQSALRQLVDSGLMWSSAGGADRIYTFKHALVQEAAYASLLNSRRQQLHARIAAEMEASWPEVVETQPELVGHHHACAGQIEQAVDYLATAGRRAVERSANIEAVRVLRRGIGLLAELPETPQRLERELALQTLLAAPLMAVRVYSAPEVGRLYERSYELARRLSKPGLMYPALAGIASFHVTRSELDKSLELAEEMLQMAEADGDQGAEMEAHRLLGMTRQWMGDFDGARRDFARVLSLYEPNAHQRLAAVYGQDHRMSALCWEAWSLLYLGYPDQAIAMRRGALDAAQATQHMFSRLYAPAVTMNVPQFIGDADGVIAAAEALVQAAEGHGFVAWAAWGHTSGGWARAQLGDAPAGMREIETGLALLRAAEVGVLMPFHLAMAAAVCMVLGRLDETVAYLAEVLDHVEQGGQRWFAAEGYRLKGVLALRQDNPMIAEALFAKAIDVARDQNAKGWELGASTSLSRLWQRQGKRKEAEDLLAPIYRWFTEGSDTKDLKEAKALLDELA